MKSVLCFALILLGLAVAESQTVDCDFDEQKPFCGWRREWLGSRRAGWKSGSKIRRLRLGDHTSGTGKFVYFLARSRPVGFQSRLRSSASSPAPDACLTFWLAMGGTKQSFPHGNAVLNLYVVSEGSPVDGMTPVWNRTHGTSRINGYQKVIVPLRKALRNVEQDGRVQFVLETIRGKSKKAVVVIDDVSLEKCSDSISSVIASSQENTEKEAEMKMKDVEKTLFDMMLPARREIEVMQFPVPSAETGTLSRVPIRQTSMRVGGYLDPVVVGRPSKILKRRRGRKSRKGRRRNGRKLRNNRDRVGKLHAKGRHLTLLPVTVAPTSPTVLCDFMEYTQKLGRCFRDFFSTLQRRPKGCDAQYKTLESCIRTAAMSCVPEAYMSQSKVEKIVLEALRDNLQTRKVFCKEDGAFVYPQFAVDKLPIQCGPRYFIKLSECSGSFSSMFHIQHGNPQLCRVYYRANQCQRQATAEECNFDVETMLLYGLNLQYQIAHNPFCLNLSFSSWWPEY